MSIDRQRSCSPRGARRVLELAGVQLDEGSREQALGDLPWTGRGTRAHREGLLVQGDGRAVRADPQVCSQPVPQLLELSNDGTTVPGVECLLHETLVCLLVGGINGEHLVPQPGCPQQIKVEPA